MLDCVMSAGGLFGRSGFCPGRRGQAALQDMDEDKVRYRTSSWSGRQLRAPGPAFPSAAEEAPWTSEIIALEEVGILGTIPRAASTPWSALSGKPSTSSVPSILKKNT